MKPILWAIPVVAVGVGLVVFYGPFKRPSGAGAEPAAAGPAKSIAAAGQLTAGSNALARGARSLAPKGTGAVDVVKAAGQERVRARSTNGVSRTEDQIAADRMQDRLDGDDVAGALEVARTLMKSKDKEVRSQVAAALGWIGVKALPELTQMLADSDPDIQKDASQQWLAAVNEIESEDLQQQMLVSGMLSMQNLDALEQSVMSFSSMDQSLAIRGLSQVIDSNNALASSVAREHYEHLTGQKYTTAAAAEELIKANAAPAAAAANTAGKK